MLDGNAVVMQGSLADKAKLVSRPGHTFRQDLSDRSRVDLISTLPLVPPPALLCKCIVQYMLLLLLVLLLLLLLLMLLLLLLLMLLLLLLLSFLPEQRSCLTNKCCLWH